MLTGLLLFVVHYALLGAWTGSLMNLVEAGMVFIAYQKEKFAWAKSSVWLFVFIGLFILSGIVTGKTWVDSCPVIAQIFGAIAVWQKSPRAIRFLMFVPRPLWFFYNFVVGSYAGMAAEIFILASVLIGIIRFDILKRSHKQGEKSR